MSPAIKWHMITGEYPPQAGGVSDYSCVVARGLAAAGDTVHVYAPENAGIEPDDDGVRIHRLPGHFGARALAKLSRSLGRNTNHRLLVQYVPHAFGFKAMNLPFCLWLYVHTRRYGGAAVIFHEVKLGFRPGDPARYRLLDAVTKLMARLVARSAAQIFVATPVWEPLLRPYIEDGQLITWLPVPSNIAVSGNSAQIAATRRRYVSACGPIIGHFSSHPPAIAAMLRSVIPRILAASSASTMILIGAHSDTFRDSLISEYPELATRVVATGALPAGELSMAIASCDVMAQPYPDGVTSRRTSMMAALEHARAIVTTQGLATEPLWQQSGAVALVPAADSSAFASAVGELIGDHTRRRRYETAAKALYASRFELCHTIEALRASVCA
ncbi:MAG: glycosyltransferase [Candidatus Binataceae bacterium]